MRAHIKIHPSDFDQGINNYRVIDLDQPTDFGVDRRFVPQARVEELEEEGFTWTEKVNGFGKWEMIKNNVVEDYLTLGKFRNFAQAEKFVKSL